MLGPLSCFELQPRAVQAVSHRGGGENEGAWRIGQANALLGALRLARTGLSQLSAGGASFFGELSAASVFSFSAFLLLA